MNDPLPIFTDSFEPILAWVCTQFAGGHVEALIASSSLESFSSFEGGDHIENPPTFSTPGMKKSTHWPALKKTIVVSW